MTEVDRKCHEADDCGDFPARFKPPDKDEAALYRRLVEGMDRPGALIDRVCVGRRFVGVASAGDLGVSATLGARPGPREKALVMKLYGRTLGQTARLLWEGESPLEVTLGLAALNAGCVSPMAPDPGDAQSMLRDLSPGRRVVIVGDFPFSDEISKMADHCDLLELRPRPGALPVEEWPEALARADVAAITGTALITRAMSWFLGQTQKAVKILVGPSTPLAGIFFKMGVKALAGCEYDNVENVLDAIGRDGTFRAIKKAGARPVLVMPRD